MIIHDAQSGRDYITVRDAFGVADAMQAGDRPRLETLRVVVAAQQNTPVLKIMMLALCDAAIARVDGNFAHSSNIILEALHHAGKLGDPAQSINPILLLLLGIHAGNLMLAGHVHEWAEETERLQDVFYTPLRAYFNRPDLEFRNMEFLRLSVPARAIGESVITGPGSDSIDLDPTEIEIDGQTQISAKAAIQLDNETVTATIGTATVMGSVPFSLQRDHHWPVIGRLSGLEDSAPDPRTEAVVLIPSIKIGQTVLTNQIMTVSRSNTVLIGLQQLTQLRHLTMTEHQLRFGSSAPISCNQTPDVKNLRSGMTMNLLFPVSYEEGDTKATFGTENNSSELLVVTLANFPASMRHHSSTEYFDTSYGKRAQEIVSQHDMIELGGKTIRSSVKYQLGNPGDFPIITAAALKNVTFSLDLPEGMACLR